MTSVAMAPRHAQKPNRVLIDAAKRMVSKYRLGYLPQDKAFDLLAFVRFLYFLARKRAMAFCAAISQEYPSRKELCQQCGAFFYQHRSCIGFLRVLGFCRCPRRCLSINRILALASSQACALVCVGGFGASEGSAAQVLLLHVVKLPFKERGRMAFRMTLMRTWEARDNRFALLFRCLPLSSALRCV